MVFCLAIWPWVQSPSQSWQVISPPEITLVYIPHKVSLGEMVAYLPIPGGHIRLAERFVNPALSFAMGWNYWYNWTIVGIFHLPPFLVSLSNLHPQLLVDIYSCCVVVRSHRSVLQPSCPPRLF